MQEGALGVWDEGVRDPEQRHEASVHTDALVSREHQPGVTPSLTEEDSCCVVLKGRCKGDKSFYSVVHSVLCSPTENKQRELYYTILISEMASMLAISRLIPISTGPSITHGETREFGKKVHFQLGHTSTQYL